MLKTSPADRLRAENLICADDAAKLVQVHPESVVRWILHGRRGRKLDGLRRDGQWYTSREALERFQGEAA